VTGDPLANVAVLKRIAFVMNRVEVIAREQPQIN
jgi:hypothetical protein